MSGYKITVLQSVYMLLVTLFQYTNSRSKQANINDILIRIFRVYICQKPLLWLQISCWQRNYANQKIISISFNMCPCNKIMLVEVILPVSSGVSSEHILQLYGSTLHPSINNDNVLFQKTHNVLLMKKSPRKLSFPWKKEKKKKKKISSYQEH